MTSNTTITIVTITCAHSACFLPDRRGATSFPSSSQQIKVRFLASNSRSLNQQNASVTLSTDTKPILASKQNRFASSKKARTQQPSADDRLPASAAKTGKAKGASSTTLATPGSINKRSKNDLKKHRQKTHSKSHTESSDADVDGSISEAYR